MTLAELLQSGAALRDGSHSSLVIRRYEEAIIETLGISKRENSFKMMTLKCAAVMIFAFTVVTGVIAILATLNRLTIHEHTFNLMWGTFVGGFTTTSLSVLGTIWKPSNATLAPTEK